MSSKHTQSSVQDSSCLIFQVELLKTSDIKPNLERVRDSKAKIVIVDFAPDLIKQFFIEVSNAIRI